MYRSICVYVHTFMYTPKYMYAHTHAHVYSFKLCKRKFAPYMHLIVLEYLASTNNHSSSSWIHSWKAQTEKEQMTREITCKNDAWDDLFEYWRHIANEWERGCACEKERPLSLASERVSKREGEKRAHENMVCRAWMSIFVHRPV